MLWMTLPHGRIMMDNPGRGVGMGGWAFCKEQEKRLHY